MTMNVLVTGANSFVGSHLCKELITRGYQVFALSYAGETGDISSLQAHKDFHMQTTEIQDKDLIQNTIRDNQIKAVFHMAARLPGENDAIDPFSCFDINARGTLNVLNAAYLGGVDSFIYASSMSVYSEPPQHLPVDESHPVQPSTVYGVAKLAGELCCNLYSKAMSMVILRYAEAYGQGERESSAIHTFIKQALNNEPITIFGDGAQTSDFVFVDDIIRGTLLALEKNKSEVYNIGSGKETSVRELARLILGLTNSSSGTAPTKRESDRPFRFFLDITKAQKILGYAPRSLEEGLRLYLKELNIKVKK
jgi:UDP-glucose 4-epimerase